LLAEAAVLVFMGRAQADLLPLNLFQAQMDTTVVAGPVVVEITMCKIQLADSMVADQAEQEVQAL
jgi:hypothetical protein